MKETVFEMHLKEEGKVAALAPSSPGACCCSGRDSLTLAPFWGEKSVRTNQSSDNRTDKS